MPHLVFGSEPQWSVFQGSGSTFVFSVTRRNVKSVWLRNDYKCLRRCALVIWMWLARSCSCSKDFFSGHSPRPLCCRVQRILKKLLRTTSFGPRQTLLPTMRERESMFWSRFSWTFFSFTCLVYDIILGGRGVNTHTKRLGFLDILLNGFCIKDSGLT